MKQKNIYEPIEIHVSDLGDWKEHVLVYHFFEIVQILQGEGTREVNKNHFDYKTGDIFLFTPLDCRGFTSNVATRFCSIRFSKIFLTDYRNKSQWETITGWLKKLEQLFYQHNRFEKLLIRDDADGQMVSGLIRNLITEYERKQSYFEENVQHFITLILNTLVRNVAPEPKQKVAFLADEPLINKMLLHIKEQIQCKEKLSVGYLSRQFHLSANYVGEYFKKMTGESLRRYIMLYKMRRVENKLNFSSLTVSEIADELGFTDESHLSRQFKKYSGYSPLHYRKLKTSSFSEGDSRAV